MVTLYPVIDLQGLNFVSDRADHYASHEFIFCLKHESQFFADFKEFSLTYIYDSKTGWRSGFFIDLFKTWGEYFLFSSNL